MENEHTDTFFIRAFLDFRHDGTYADLSRGTDLHLKVIFE